MALLKIANLKKSYNITKTQKQDVLKGINIEFNSGDIVALLGESGCGKSTLINILGGLDTDYTGSVIVKNDFIRDFNEKQMDDYRKKRVGLIFQNYNLIGHMTLLENVEIAMKMSNIEPHARHERAMDLLKMVGLAKYSKKLPNQLSGGQKQRVAIARSLANNPTILLADEPTGALDKDSAEVVMNILKKIAQKGKLVIIVTHSQKVADQCSRIVKIEEGKITSDQKTQKLKIDKSRDKEIKPKSIQVKGVADLAIKNIKNNKSRSLLVSVGMSIGIAAVVLILCLSTGLSNYVNNVYASNLQSLQITATTRSGTNFSTANMETIEQLDSINTVNFSKTFSVSYTYESTTSNISNLSAYYSTFSPELLYGELSEDTNSIIINQTLANELSQDGIIASIGNSITLSFGENTQTVTIAAIYDDTTEDYEQTNALTTASVLNNLYTSSYYNIAYITADESTSVSSLISDLNALGFSTYQSDSSAQEVLDYIDLGTTVLTGVGAISMVVSAIMIFIVLYISVVERMKEIGILRAIGARKKDIRRMFLVEAATLGLLSGLFGVATTFVVSLATNIISANLITYSLISYHIGYYLFGIVLSTVISVLSGIAPAVHAADLDPVEALRYE